MARIDVTELFSDPDFCDAVKIIRRASAVNSYGENFIKETDFDSVGSVQPTDGPTMKRLPQALQNENVSSFWVKGDLSDTQGCKYPPILVFKGKRFQVRHIFDWTNWGSGWSEGLCVAEKLS